MVKLAESLTCFILPYFVGYRQYVLTVPITLRHWMARSQSLLVQVYRIFSAETQTWVESNYDKHHEETVKITSGSVAFIQQFGDGLRFHSHIHLLISEGGGESPQTSQTLWNLFQHSCAIQNNCVLCLKKYKPGSSSTSGE